MGTASTSKRRTSDQPARAHDALSLYCSEVAPHRLLTAEEERRIAREIEHNDVRVWTILLGDPPTSPFVLDLLDRLLPDGALDTSALRRSIDAARTSRRRAERERLLAVAGSLARELRALDLDRGLRDAVIRELRRAADIQAAGGGRDWGFRASSQRFAVHLERVESALCASAHARRIFVESNLKLVFAIARRYESGPLSLLDLLQEGNLGLMKAVDRFDHRRGYRFSTYASWWIRNAIGRAISDTGTTVRLPSYLSERRRQVAQARSALSVELDRDPTLEEVAVRLGMKPERLARLEAHLAQQEISLDQPVNDEFSHSRREVFQDPNAELRSPFDELNDRMTREHIDRLIARMTPMEASVIRQRFGLDGSGERTLQQIADQKGLSRERIRQIQARALQNLRAAWRAHDRLRLVHRPANRDNVGARRNAPHPGRPDHGQHGQR